MYSVVTLKGVESIQIASFPRELEYPPALTFENNSAEYYNSNPSEDTKASWLILYTDISFTEQFILRSKNLEQSTSILQFTDYALGHTAIFGSKYIGHLTFSILEETIVASRTFPNSNKEHWLSLSQPNIIFFGGWRAIGLHLPLAYIL